MGFLKKPKANQNITFAICRKDFPAGRGEPVPRWILPLLRNSNTFPLSLKEVLALSAREP